MLDYCGRQTAIICFIHEEKKIWLFFDKMIEEKGFHTKNMPSRMMIKAIFYLCINNVMIVSRSHCTTWNNFVFQKEGLKVVNFAIPSLYIKNSFHAYKRGNDHRPRAPVEPSVM